MTGSLPNREIFKVGTWKGSSKVVADKSYLAQMVQSFADLNSQVPGFAVPLKLGHNKRVGEPAFGYAENVRLSEDGGTVLADFMDMPPEIVDQITKKQYNTVSVEIWPSVEYEGKTYPNVLSGVALLGAEWPAVKGLKPLSMFSEQEAPQLLSQEEEVEMKTFTETEHDTLMAAAVAAAVAEATGKLTAAEQRAETAEAALAAFRDEAEKASVAAVIEAAEKAGKIVPANKPAILAMAEAIRSTVDPAKRKEALAAFSAFVDGLAKKVELDGENGASEQDEIKTGSAADRVDAAAKKLMAEKKAENYRVALDMVFAADPALKTAYAEENR
jgi:hypothetical protein